MDIFVCWFVFIQVLLASSVQGTYCPTNRNLATLAKPKKTCEGLEYTVVSSGKIPMTYEDKKACCDGYYGQACDIPKCSCSKNELCSDKRECICPGNKRSRNGNCITEPCNSAIDCYPGSCSQAGSKCVCASGFTSTNQSNVDCAKIRYGPTFSSCSIIVDGKSFDVNCSDQAVKTTIYTRMLTAKPTIIIQFNAAYDPPSDTPEPSGVVRSAKLGITDVNINIETAFQDKAANHINKVPCSNPPPYPRRISLTCNETFNFTKAVKTHSLAIRASSGGYREIMDTTIITKQMEITTTILTVLITTDTTPPSCSTDKCRPIVICPDITREEFTIEWSEWADAESGIASYEWSVFELVKKGQSLVQAPHPLTKGYWQPGELYPKYLPQQSGMYAAVLNVTDKTGNSKAARTWVFYDPSSIVVTTRSTPITLAEAHEESRYEWTSVVGEVHLTYNWTDGFANLVHEQGLLYKIESNSSYEDHFTKRKTIGHENKRGIVKFEYFFNITNSDKTNLTLLKPTKWEDLQLNNSVMVTEVMQQGSTLHFWLRATDFMGNSLTTKLETHVDGTAPSFRLQTESLDTTPPTNGNATLLLETNKPIDGIPHFTSSILTFIQDMDSGIGWASVKLKRQNSVLLRTIAPAVSYSESECPSKCYCLKVTKQCFPYMVEALINNCDFLGINTTNTILNVIFTNQAGLPSNDIAVPIAEDLSSNSALNNYPPPINVTVLKTTTSNATLTWKYYGACYKKMELEMKYTDNKQTRHYTKNLTMLTSNMDTVTLTDLTSNTEYKVTLTLIYEGNVESNSSAITSFHTESNPPKPGLSGGAIAGIVIGVLALLVLIILLVHFKGTWHPAATKLLQSAKSKTMRNSFAKSDFPMATMDSQEEIARLSGRPLPTLPRSNPTAPINEIRSDTLQSDPLKIYDDVEPHISQDYSGIRTVSPDQYDLFEELGRGKLAVVKAAVLSDQSTPEHAAAKLNFPSATEDQKILLRAKLNFLAKEVPPHPNIINFIAADISAPILFMEECDQGPLTTYLKTYRSFNQQVSDTLMNFCKDIALALIHLHSNKIIHRRLGVRNVLLATSSTHRLTAKVTGFGPTEFETESTHAIRVPVKWMPPEYFQKAAPEGRIANEALDIWAYGITLWEIYSRGERPYKGLKGPSMKNFILSGKRLAKPTDCSHLLYNNVMLHCWDEIQERRPKAHTILADLNKYFPSDLDNFTPTTKDSEMDLYNN